MSKTEQKYQMSKKQKRGNSLPRLQKKIILCLAKNGALTINECVKKIKHQYKATWIAFQSLKEKGIIKEISSKIWRGNEYPQFWLTEEGIFLSFIEGASKDVLLEKSKEFYPDNKNLHAFLDFASIFNPEIWKIAYYSIKRKGKLEPVDLAMIMVTQMESDANLEKVKEGLIQLKKYPEILESLKKLMEGLDKVKEFVSEVLES
ncbi:MAG: hypothetical protein NZ932_00720 [Candidatus Bathyarchaeota archaeon]|nr:hypothetical protein [Candidatus Bathyarchaeota archaeon]